MKIPRRQSIGNVLLGITLICSALSIAQIATVSLLPQTPSSRLSSTWEPAGPSGGVIYSLTIDRINPTTLYAGTDNGIFKSSDSGFNWNHLSFTNSQIKAIQIDYNTVTKTVYAAGASAIGRSFDDGRTWQNVVSGIGDNCVCINDLAVDPAQGEKLWLATNMGVLKWDKSIAQWVPTTLVTLTTMLRVQSGHLYAVVARNPPDISKNPQMDLLRSDDDGVSWTSIIGQGIPDDNQQRAIRSLLVNPIDSQIMYLGTWYGGTYKTINGGQNWILLTTDIPQFTEVKDIQFDPTNLNTVYVATHGYFIDSTRKDISITLALTGVFRSNDGGGTWTNVSSGLGNRYTRVLAVHPTEPSIVYVGTDGAGVFRSADKGFLWQNSSLGIYGNWINALVGSDNALYAAREKDGFHRSADNGLTWQRLNQGLPEMTLSASSIVEDETGVVYGAVRKWGMLRLMPSGWVTTTTTLTQTDVATILPVSGTLFIAASSPETTTTQLLSSNDQGKTWNLRMNGLPAKPFDVRSLISVPNSEGSMILAATSSGLFQTTIQGQSWIQITGGLPSNGINGLAKSASNPAILFATTWCDYVYRSTDGGGTWKQLKTGLPTGCFDAVDIDPTDSNRIYVGSGTKLFTSSTGGAFWNEVDTTGVEFGNYYGFRRLIALRNQGLLTSLSTSLWRLPSVNPSITPTPRPQATWTALIYLSGDNDLDYYMQQAFNRLERAVALNSAIQVVVLWDRPGAGNTREYLVQGDLDISNLSSNYKLNQNFWDWGELNMGAGSTLKDFINRSRARFPSTHYLLSIIDHGGGWSPELFPGQARGRWTYGGSGFSWDSTSDQDYLSTQETGEVFRNVTQVGGKLDVIFYDACNMAMLEEVYQLRNAAQYLVASQNATWTSFPYDEYLNSVTPSTTPLELATSIVNKYMISLSTYPRTMSVFDLQRVDSFVAAVDEFAQTMQTLMPQYKSQISQAITNTQKLDYNFDFYIEPNESYVDLLDFAIQVKLLMSDTVAATAAERLLSAFADPHSKLVAYEKHQSDVAWKTNSLLDLDHVNGISVYLPNRKFDQDHALYMAGGYEFATDTQWDELILKLTGLPSGVDLARGRGNVARPGNLRAIYLPVLTR